MSLKKLDVYPLHNYSASYEGEQKRQGTIVQYLTELKNSYETDGCTQRSVEGVLVAHLNHHPHILVLKQGINMKRDTTTAVRSVNPPTAAGGEVHFRLPGGRCRKDENEEMCLVRRLGRQLLGEEDTTAAESSTADTIVEVGRTGRESKASSVFRVGELVSKWHRPLFSPLMYPYIPPHLSYEEVKETKSIFLVHLDAEIHFNLLESHTQLVAVPLFDLYENSQKYGSILASLPSVLSKISINYCNIDY